MKKVNYLFNFIVFAPLWSHTSEPLASCMKKDDVPQKFITNSQEEEKEQNTGQAISTRQEPIIEDVTFNSHSFIPDQAENHIILPFEDSIVSENEHIQGLVQGLAQRDGDNIERVQAANLAAQTEVRQAQQNNQNFIGQNLEQAAGLREKVDENVEALDNLQEVVANEIAGAWWPYAAVGIIGLACIGAFGYLYYTMRAMNQSHEESRQQNLSQFRTLINFPRMWPQTIRQVNTPAPESRGLRNLWNSIAWFCGGWGTSLLFFLKFFRK